MNQFGAIKMRRTHILERIPKLQLSVIWDLVVLDLNCQQTRSDAISSLLKYYMGKMTVPRRDDSQPSAQARFWG